MKSNAVGIAGVVLVLLGLAATVCVFAFQDQIRKLDWIDREAAALGSMAICLVGCVLGWVTFRNPAGRVAAILGTLLVAFYVFQLLRTDRPAAPAEQGLTPAPTKQAQSHAGK